ncbi:pilus assembly protein PilP [Puniceibacterium sediminis]|uniref:Pilus assembly protein, PilP n=1 Tax=Puniceibacterium sediminis TaxID=1608407 RepID=A0A238XID2_9RHOB|nr:pilus assembly protein PilP [Puniceibacterium sediminis]SNR58338.1 Pilus assembly protein, PilP [Puniceibacterium sediminis]
MTQTTTTQTPTSVARSATHRTEINLNRLVLLGTFGTQAAPQALLRLPDGRVARVSLGDRLGQDTVYAIDAARIALGQNGRAQWLEMPGG